MTEYSESFFKDVLDSMKDMVLVKGERSNLKWANAAFLDYYGMNESELYQIVDGPQSDPDDTLQYIRDDQTVWVQKAHLNIPSEIIKDKLGQGRPFHTIKSPIWEGSEVKMTLGVSRLIDENSIAQTTLPHDEAKLFSAPLRSITRSFPLPVILLDLTGRIVNGSPKWLEEFDEFKEELRSEFFDEAYPRLMTIYELRHKLKQTGVMQEFTMSHLKEGTPKSYQFCMDYWYYPNGARGGFTITASDITSVIESHQALQRSKEELEIFAYSASHDLKSPLRAISHLAQWIAEDDENQLSVQSTNDLGELKTRTEFMSEMLDALYTYSQVGKTDSTMQTIDLDNLVKRLKRLGAVDNSHR